MSEKYLEFIYNEKRRKLYRMVGKADFVEGIELSALSEEEQKEFEIITEEFHKKLEPFMAKAYRRFDPKKMLY